ncbi:glucose repression mediator protein [Exophiala aquamarina CBS 119918]|uniref:Glucose repression mediator protein n=1 Tax=Exophiala aquamarina CBS 119918 TaxID=1182545 RepID=A0A072PLX0_9EURO|nr:glucose repression mediator protein [Exophiala aquamarina CBS 119918]KEF60308.1 glucose repression mediator protein [Exophiala aquamarina CBS 119918]
MEEVAEAPSGVLGMQRSLQFMQVNDAAPAGGCAQKKRLLAQLNESTWDKIGFLNEVAGDLDDALFAYEQALRHNQRSTRIMNTISRILRSMEKYPEAIELLQNILRLEPSNGEVWCNLGHCYLMTDNLQEAYGAYKQALYHLPDPADPKLWYGFGILYERYGLLKLAEEAFIQVVRVQPNSERAKEVYFRLGVIYKQQQKFQPSLECFRYIVQDPPLPLREEDIWFQIGNVHEQENEWLLIWLQKFESAEAAYKRVSDMSLKRANIFL